MEIRTVDIPGYEGFYSIDEYGNITNVRRNKPLQPRSDKDGYLRVALQKNRVRKEWIVHRLVALSFIGEPPPDKPLALHNDGNNINNHFSNIRWGSHFDNTMDKMAHGTYSWKDQTHCKNGHEYTEENTYITPGCQYKSRSCRKCRNIASAKAYKKRRNKT